MKARIDFHRRGNCYRLLSLPKRQAYFSGSVTNYSWWRFALVLDWTL